jgi:hypothetical protein
MTRDFSPPHNHRKGANGVRATQVQDPQSLRIRKDRRSRSGPRPSQYRFRDPVAIRCTGSSSVRAKKDLKIEAHASKVYHISHCSSRPSYFSPTSKASITVVHLPCIYESVSLPSPVATFRTPTAPGCRPFFLRKWLPEQPDATFRKALCLLH